MRTVRAIARNSGQCETTPIRWPCGTGNHGVSQAFAETEGVSTEWMHAVLEKEVRGFEDPTHFKFVWERSFKGKSPSYPKRLGENLAKQKPSRTLN